MGESLFWKIERGIRENEFFSIIMSPEALNSECVKNELGAAMQKQIAQKKIFILPVLLRDCDIPWLLADKKYADFRKDYQYGFRELAGALGIKQTEVLSEENWRWFARHQKNTDWRHFREKEFERLVTQLTDLAKQYNWGTWVGSSKMPFSILFEAYIPQRAQKSVTLRLDGRTYGYVATEKAVSNPNHLSVKDFDCYVGNTSEECQEYIWRHMSDFHVAHGNPPGEAFHSNYRYLNFEKQVALAHKMAAELSWYKGKYTSDTLD